jgi:uncharacterized membrane protein
VFGGLSIILFVIGLIPVVQIIVIPLWIVGFIYWVIFMVQALQGNGERIQAPGLSGFINQYVDQLANSVK